MKWKLCYKIHINNTSMKQKFITILKLITSRGNRNNSLKKKNIYIYIYIKWKGSKEDKTTQGSIFITSLSFRVLLSWVIAVVEDARPLPLVSSLVGIGRVARTILILWGVSFSLDGSLGSTRGRIASWATSLVTSNGFSAPSSNSASLDEFWTERRVLAELSFPISASLEATSALGLDELEA